MKSPGIKVTQSQRLQLNTSLQASIRLLRADASGLTLYLEEQAAENPAIRLETPAPAPGEWLPRWQGAWSSGLGGDAMDRVASAAPSLVSHVVQEITRLDLPPPDRRIALALVEALEPSGWLGVPLSTIAAAARVPVPAVESVLDRVQRIDPPGLFARNLRECLFLQARDEGFADTVLTTVLAHLDLLAKGELARIARLGGITEAEVEGCFRRIRRLDPKPGARFAAHAAPVREPDLLVRQGETGWEVSLNRSALPTITVEVGRGPGRAAARTLARLVDSRNATLLRVGQEISRRQVAALDRGLTALSPMTMADVARALDLHESTISRIVAGVAMDTPLGTWWLRALFGGARGGDTEAAGGVEAVGLSVAALRARLAQAVAAEDPAHPLSDAALTAHLTAAGANVARRTVADYRKALGIPPAHRRRRTPVAG
ncbi:MAG: RNA polymerase sigma-54 factor [Rhodobacteraceae bacterium PARR1]|nr:MAG: RNA polymerase sigma-54 factor [Rhodobacteraceae bacterium PARR1]